jgi:hypothetical protein
VKTPDFCEISERNEHFDEFRVRSGRSVRQDFPHDLVEPG